MASEFLITHQNMSTKKALELMQRQWSALWNASVVRGEEQDSLVYELDEEDDDDDDDDDRPNEPIIKRSFVCPDSLGLYADNLMDFYNKKQFFILHLNFRENPLIAYITKELEKFFIKKLKTKTADATFNVLHSIHSFISNKRALPDVYEDILANENILTPLFNSNFECDFEGHCFLIKEISADILSELFVKSEETERVNSFLTNISKLFVESKGKELEDSFLTALTKLRLKSFCNFRNEPFAPFYAIAVYLALGIETLPEDFYPSLKSFFNHLCRTASRNTLSSNCISRVWDKFMLLCEHWVKYYLSYPILECLDSPFSNINIDDCIEPDPSIFDQNSLFWIIRNEMRYEYVHVEGDYVPCEYPLIYSLPPSNVPDHCFSFKAAYLDLNSIVGDIIEVGYCEECRQNNCSCIQSFIEQDMDVIMTSSSESDMDIDIDTTENVSFVRKNALFSPQKTQLWFDCPHSIDEDIIYEDTDYYYDYIYGSDKYNVSYLISDPCLSLWENAKFPEFPKNAKQIPSPTPTPTPKKSKKQRRHRDKCFYTSMARPANKISR